MKTLALIHTSMVFINVETMMQDLYKEIMPDVRLINIVDDSLLPDVMETGKITPEVTSRMIDYIVAAEKTGADAILSLCSSLGPTIDEARKRVKIPVIKIDDAMAQIAAKSANKIGVMATVPTTLGPTVDLIKEKAIMLQKEIEVTPCLVKGAFELLMNGEKDTHDQMVLESAKELAKSVDIIVFAQASMTRLSGYVSRAVEKDVLTSPRVGIEYTKSFLDSL
jgi:Asp/Glu/hydantoin racemase